MNDLGGTNNKHDEDELKSVPEFMRGSAYLEKRQQQILQSEQEYAGLQGRIRNVAFAIDHLLVAAPSAGNQAKLERSFSKLNGLANAAAQTAAGLPTGGDSGASRGADVDLNGTKAAIATHAESSSGTALKDIGDRTKNKTATGKALPSLETSPTLTDDQRASGEAKTIDAKAGDTKADETAPGDAKPIAADAPVSNMDRVKQALAKGGEQADPTSTGNSDLAALPNRRGGRLNVAALKVDHAEAATKPDAADGQRAQSVAPKTQVASTVAEARHAAARNAPSPGGM